jgi:hypothetical protein
MGLARVYNRTLHRQLHCHAAWPPFANGCRLGDYGLVAGGVFQRLGNIEEFGVEAIAAPDPPAASLDFVSEAARVGRFAGDVEVNVFPDEPIAARLALTFERSDALVLKAATIRVHEMTNVAAAGRALARKRRWRHRYKVVRQVWVATDGMVLATRAADTEVTFGARADVLRRLELGSVGVDVDVSADRDLALEMVGKTGPVGLGLFRVRLLGGIDARPLSLKGEDEDAVETSDDWPEDLEDDI